MNIAIITFCVVWLTYHYFVWVPYQRFKDRIRHRINIYVKVSDVLDRNVIPKVRDNERDQDQDAILQLTRASSRQFLNSLRLYEYYEKLPVICPFRITKTFLHLRKLAKK